MQKEPNDHKYTVYTYMCIKAHTYAIIGKTKQSPCTLLVKQGAHKMFAQLVPCLFCKLPRNSLALNTENEIRQNFDGCARYSYMRLPGYGTVKLLIYLELKGMSPLLVHYTHGRGLSQLIRRREICT